MDKYELNLKIEQIKKLAAKKSYEQAAALAKDINWLKIKDWSTLATIINLQEQIGDYEEARDMAILAYNRNLGGKRLVYKLAELFIKLNEFEEAQELYYEYEKMAPRDSRKYILYYNLRQAQGAADTELVGILEDYREQDLNEHYMYELARLYANTSRKEECIKLCDEIAILFQDGVYVENALALKQELGVTLTSVQRQQQKDVLNKKNDKEELFNKQKELVRLQQDDIEDAFIEDDMAASGKGRSTAVNTDAKKNSAGRKKERTGVNSDSHGQKSIGNTINLDNIKTNIDETGRLVSKEIPKQQGQYINPDTQAKSSEKTQMPETLKEIIANAKKKLENSYDRMNREDEREGAVENEQNGSDNLENRDDSIDIEVEVPKYNLYDTQNVQEELAKNLNELLEADKSLSVFTPDETYEEVQDNGSEQRAVQQDGQNVADEQIDGQLNLADWLIAVKENKYGKQDTREYSRAELERLLDEKDEKSEAYEKLVEQQKLAEKSNEAADENENELRMRAQMMIHAAKTDLAIRTGKATLKLEEAIENLKEAAAAVPKDENEVISLNTASFKAVTDEDIKAYNEEVPFERGAASETFTEVRFTEVPLSQAEYAEVPNTQVPLSQAEYMEVPDTQVPLSQAGYTEAPFMQYRSLNAVKPLPLKDIENGTMTGDLAKIFRRYKDMPGLETQLVELFTGLAGEMCMSTSNVGNILISGNSSSDKTDLARNIVRAINYLFPDNTKKIAKTTGDSINSRGLTKAMGKLKGTALIVEGAGSIQPKRIDEIIECLNMDTDRMIVIFEDSDRDMNLLLKFNPDLESRFNHRIVLKQYTVNELVEMARTFARKRQYEVDDDALLQLYLKIDKLRTTTDNIRLDDIKDIINKAIESSEKRAAKRFFGGIKKKRGEKGDIFFLSEADFKD